jgi:penicillin-binding protein 2
MPKKKLSNRPLDPDEIFADEENFPGFDKYQFEGRLEKPIAKPTFIGIAVCFVILGGLLFAKIAHLEILRGEAYADRSKNNYLRAVSIFPSRGIIYDRNGKELAWNDSLVEEENLKLVRAYSGQSGLGHVLGYTGIGSGGKIIGKDGIEKKYENSLGGVVGIKLIETDSKNEVVSESVIKTPANGKNLKLTIDAELQSAFYSILESVIRERGFNGGAGVVMDVRSGEVLALMSYPEYDSQILSRGKPEAVIKSYLENKQKPFVNRAISGLYAPGSIIKPMLALAALKEKIIDPAKQIFSSGSISLPNPFFPDKKNIFYDWKAHGWVDMRRALAVSSNVYFYTIGGGYEDIKGLGITKIEKYADLFGFGSETNIDLDKEEKGLIPSPALKALNPKDPVWRIGDTYNASIGQGDFQITPVQAAVYAAAIANNGRLVHPYLVAQEFPPAGETIDIPSEYFQIVREGMRMVVLEGTAQGLAGLGVKIAAKTGTAELESEANKFVNSWIIGFLPYENPKISFSILLEKGRATNLVGGVFAARQLLEWMLIHTPRYLNLTGAY